MHLRSGCQPHGLNKVTKQEGSKASGFLMRMAAGHESVDGICHACAEGRPNQGGIGSSNCNSGGSTEANNLVLTEGLPFPPNTVYGGETRYNTGCDGNPVSDAVIRHEERSFVFTTDHKLQRQPHHLRQHGC